VHAIPDIRLITSLRRFAIQHTELPFTSAVWKYKNRDEYSLNHTRRDDGQTAMKRRIVRIERIDRAIERKNEAMNPAAAVDGDLTSP
jgi:hypothetical protein